MLYVRTADARIARCDGIGAMCWYRDAADDEKSVTGGGRIVLRKDRE